MPVAIALTLFMVTGVANAINIIDGFNGLASMCMVMMFGGAGLCRRSRSATPSSSPRR